MMTSIPAFTDEVPDNGYRWWYVDAQSDDGQNAITLILFVGSVFSPYYAWARKRQANADAADFCALNVALYGSKKCWAMTERNAAGVKRSPNRFELNKSCVTKTDAELRFDIDEWTVPIPRRVRGKVSISLNHSSPDAYPIDSQQKHFWQPLAPHTRIEVNMNSPDLSWEGNCYVDSNFGRCALETTFKQWHWSRAHLSNNTTLVQYDTEELNGHTAQNTWNFNQSMASEVHTINAQKPLKTTPIWRIKRHTRIEGSANIENLRTLEDTPFYARSSYETTIDGVRANCMHESLNLKRFASPWVQCLLPFRMPRRSLSIKRLWTTHNA